MKTMKQFLILSVAILSMSAMAQAEATVGQKAEGTEGCITSADGVKGSLGGEGQTEAQGSTSGTAVVTPPPPAPKK